MLFRSSASRIVIGNAASWYSGAVNKNTLTAIGIGVEFLSSAVNYTGSCNFISHNGSTLTTTPITMPSGFYTNANAYSQEATVIIEHLSATLVNIYMGIEKAGPPTLVLTATTGLPAAPVDWSGRDLLYVQHCVVTGTAVAGSTGVTGGWIQNIH